MDRELQDDVFSKNDNVDIFKKKAPKMTNIGYRGEEDIFENPGYQVNIWNKAEEPSKKKDYLSDHKFNKNKVKVVQRTLNLYLGDSTKIKPVNNKWKAVQDEFD